MPDICIFKRYNYGDYYEENLISIPVSFWEEISEEKLEEILTAIKNANYMLSKKNMNYRFSLQVRNPGHCFLPEIFKNSEEFIEMIDKEERKKKEAEKKAREKRESSALLKKQKQYEKLKKELKID